MNPNLNFSLEGKVALVTGASYGIGFAIASAFAEQGATICFNDINQELVNKGLASYKEKGIDAHGYVCDVTDEPAVQALVAQITKEVGPIDILVNNAGIIRRVPMHEMEAADFRKVIDIDLNAPFIVSKAVLPSMMERRHGKIINLAQGERCVVIFFLIGRGRTAIEQHLPHLLFIHKSGVSTGDDGRGLIGPCRNMYLDIKFFGNVFFQFYVDAILGDELFSPFHIGRSDVFEHFELIIGIPGQRTESHGNGQSDHARPGYADPHGVFQDIGTQQHFNFFRFFAQ